MNYSNMIEEKKLKKGFIIATLVSTLVGTITASMNLHDKVQEKRSKAQQKGVDTAQDGQIKQLRQEVERLQIKENGSQGNGGRKRSRSSSRDRQRKAWSRSTSSEDDGFDRSAARSRAMIERQYDDLYARMGSKYAQGDVVTENKLQAQVISLQQTVINVLQDALMNGRNLTRSDISRLIAAQDAARDGSLDALRDQYDRMLLEEGPLPVANYSRNRHSSWSQEPVYAPPRRQLTLPAIALDSSSDSFPPPRRVQTTPATSSLYCRYSEDLQSSRKALHPAFASSGSHRCPACGVTISVDTQDFWVFEINSPVREFDGRDAVQTRSYCMDARFVVKSHTASGRFACALCSRHRDLDCICKNIEALVRHLGREHSADEFEREEDLVRM